MSDIQFVDIDAESLTNQLIADFESATGETLYPGDERRIFLMQFLPWLIGVKNDINNTGRQNLLRYAAGENLDAIGERTDTPRLPAQAAVTTLRFTLSDARSQDTAIPAGIRATPDGTLYFATVRQLIIAASQLTGDIQAQAVESGEKYNGYTPGQISTLVDPVAYIAGVQNIDTSSGGADAEADDDGTNVWSGYRERIREAPSKLSTAGPADGYTYWAKTADVNIQDVGVLFPSPGHVRIVVLVKDGPLPSQAVLDAVTKACNDRKRRPMTDYVTVLAPEVVTYNINLTYYIAAERVAEESSIRNTIESMGGIVDQYKAWQEGKLGRAVNPDYLRQLMLNAGAFRIEVTEPVYTPVDADKVAVHGTVTVQYGGLV